MAKSGDILEHPVTGERLVWRKVARDTGGELLQADLYVAPGGFVAAEHVHPMQEERFEVLAGVLRLHIDGKEKTMRTGESEVVPAGRPHVWWNGGQEELHVLGEFRPARRTEMFFEAYCGWAKDGKTNRKGLPNPLRLAVLVAAYQDELRLARPPFAIQIALVDLQAAASILKTGCWSGSGSVSDIIRRVGAYLLEATKASMTVRFSSPCASIARICIVRPCSHRRACPTARRLRAHWVSPRIATRYRLSPTVMVRANVVLIWPECRPRTWSTASPVSRDIKRAAGGIAAMMWRSNHDGLTYVSRSPIGYRT